MFAITLLHGEYLMLYAGIIVLAIAVVVVPLTIWLVKRAERKARDGSN